MRRDLLYPVLAICAIGWFGLIAMIYVASVGQNKVALADSERLVQSLLAAESKKIGLLARDYTWWDDSIRNLLVDFDREWASGNVGVYLADTFGVTQSVVFAGDNRIIYGQREGEDLEAPTMEGVAGEMLLPLVRKARGANGRRLSERYETPEPVPVSGFVRVGEHIWVVGASVLIDEGEDDSPTGYDDKATLVLARQIDGDMVAELADSYGLTGLSLTGSGGGGDALLPIVGFGGKVIGGLTWQPDLPGSTLLARLVPAAAAGVLLTLGLLVMFIRRAGCVVEEIERSAAVLASNHALLGARERELRALVNNVADGIVTVGERGQVLALNPSASRILGWRGDEALEQPVLALLGQDDTGRDWTERLRRMVGQTVTGRRRDGSQFLMELSVGGGRDGEAGRTVVALRDVTERARAQATLNLLATPMLVLDGDLKPVLTNASAQSLIAAADGLTLDGGAVRLWRATETTHFRGLVDAAMGRTEARDTGIMTVSRPSGRQPLALLVTAMRAATGGADESPLAVVFLRDPEHRWEVPAKVLQELYELTPAESRVAIELVNGASPKEVARTFNVSVNTVRNQIKQTYRKTGTSRQSQLVALMLTTAALVSDRLDDAA